MLFFNIVMFYKKLKFRIVVSEYLVKAYFYININMIYVK